MNIPTSIIPIKNLIPHPQNYNDHPDKQVDGLAESLETYGQFKNIVAWTCTENVVLDNGVELQANLTYILAGHGLWQAAKQSGMNELEVKDYSKLSYEEAIGLLLIDNASPLGSNPNADRLSVLVEQTKGLVIDKPKLSDMIDLLREQVGVDKQKQESEDTPPQIDKAQELQEKWGVQIGDLWQLGEHRLICGDCTDKSVVERVMGGRGADACITDPPYGISVDINYTRFTGFTRGVSPSKGRNFGNGIANDDKPFDPSPLLNYKKVILWGANYYTLPRGTWLVWDKRYKGQDKILSDGELGWVNKGIGVYIFNHGWNGFMRESERGKTLHPTQKPIVLFEWCMQWLDDNDTIVYDPYCGSGPVIIACENLSRQCRAIEISPAYCAVTLERFFQHTKIKPELIDRIESQSLWNVS